MSNHKLTRQLAELFAEQLRCPDCNNDAHMTQIERGIYTLTISHDHTCPNYKEMTGDRQ